MLPRDRLRPAGVPVEDVAACLGLISDTHYPERLDRLPDAVFEVLRGVDLILHAGDVGALSVLDELGAVAPVVAVHGNDERLEETQRELPYQQVIAIAGQRIVLSHTHHPDLALEMESRKGDAWGPKLDRRAAFLLFQTTILDAKARSLYERLRASARAHGPDTLAAARDAMRHACMPCWTGQRERLSPNDIFHAIETVPKFTSEQRTLMRSLVTDARTMRAP